MEKLKKGDRVADFQLPGQDGQEVNLVDYRGHKVLIFFYPLAAGRRRNEAAGSVHLVEHEPSIELAVFEGPFP